ncbi:class I SAM-dependent methyltransferase [Microbaculum marinum]|uniref:Class I SAM-dependent methyltransferase n=1 Tax=Microbaculum marinum TaxID=1764581 RepID=A0AAW9RVI9_9HYPH
MLSEDLIEKYDAAITSDKITQLFGQTGFYNTGSWPDGLPSVPENMVAASRELVQRHLDIETPESLESVSAVLDVACGLGATTRRFVAAYPNADVTGINISQRQIDIAADRCPGVRFHRMDAVAMDFPDDSFDRIHCVESAFYFDTRYDFFREALRLIRPDGVVVVSDVLFRAPFGIAMPNSNLGETVESYRETLLGMRFRILRMEDITSRTVVPFSAMAADHTLGYDREMTLYATANYLLVALQPC